MATESLPRSCQRSATGVSLLLFVGGMLYSHWLIPALWLLLRGGNTDHAPGHLATLSLFPRLFLGVHLASGVLILLALLAAGRHRHLLRVSGRVTRYLAPPDGWSITAWIGGILFALATIAHTFFPTACQLFPLRSGGAASEISACSSLLRGAYEGGIVLSGGGSIAALIACTVLFVRYYGKNWTRHALMWALLTLSACHVASTVYVNVSVLTYSLPLTEEAQRLAITASSLWVMLMSISPTGRALIGGHYRVIRRSLSHSIIHATTVSDSPHDTTTRPSP